MKISSLAFLCLLAMFLPGCSQQAMIEKFAPMKEVEYSKRYLALFQKKDFDAISKSLSPELKTPQLRSQLEQIAQFFPSDPPKGIELVGSQTYSNGDRWQASLTLQYEFSQLWLIANINLERIGEGELVVSGIHVNPIQDSLVKINRFNLKNRTLLHYLFLAFSIIVPLFIVLSFIACLRTPMRKRKWLWALFVLLGFVEFSFNWTTGEIGAQPISFLLLGSGFFFGSKFAPVVLTTSIPVGAIAFWFRRAKIMADKATGEKQLQMPESERTGSMDEAAG